MGVRERRSKRRKLFAAAAAAAAAATATAAVNPPLDPRWQWLEYESRVGRASLDGLGLFDVESTGLATGSGIVKRHGFGELFGADINHAK
jgi:hypothetical protein